MAILIPPVRPAHTGCVPGAIRRRPLRSLRHGSIWMLLSCAIAMGSLSDLQPQTPPPGEYEVKAAFLYNFAKFVEWPSTAFPAPDSPVIIGVLGEDPFGEALELTIAGKLVQGRPLQVQRGQRIENVESCHILFFSSSQRRPLPELLGQLRSLPVLTVGEEEKFIEQGGVIRFLLDDNRVRFDINNLSARKAGLKISSRLLALASHVWE
ncbi:MAG: YfiR family protein [Acidobacteria bacterium]|nr:YfiR family protein [Acidobacteriota bacterium]